MSWLKIFCTLLLAPVLLFSCAQKEDDPNRVIMTPVETRDAYAEKLKEKGFEVDKNILFLHDDNTISMLIIDVNRREPVDTSWFKEGKQSKYDQSHYIDESFKFINEYADLFGFTNIDKGLDYSGLQGSNRKDNASARVVFSYKIEGVMLDGASVSVIFDKEMSVRRFHLKFPKLTEEAYYSIKDAVAKKMESKNGVILDKAEKQFIELGRNAGWFVEGTSSEINTILISPNSGSGSNATVDPPYLTPFMFDYSFRKPAKGFENAKWRLHINALTGDLVEAVRLNSK